MKKILLFFFFITFFSFSSFAQLTSPILIAPPTTSSNVTLTPLLQWDAVSGADDYEVQISIDPAFGSLIPAPIPLVTESSFQVQDGMLQGNTTYYWRVIAHSTSLGSSTSDIFSFTTAATPTQLIDQLSGDVDNLVNQNVLSQNQGNILQNRLQAASHQIDLGHNLNAIVHMLLFKFRVEMLEMSGMLDETQAGNLQSSADNIINVLNQGNAILPPVSSLKAHNFGLGQNYPNPFNPSTNIEYTIPEKAHVTLKIFDILGKEVATLVDKEQQPGSYVAIWNASKVSSGIYFYRLTAGSNVQTKRMALKK